MDRSDHLGFHISDACGVPAEPSASDGVGTVFGDGKEQRMRLRAEGLTWQRVGDDIVVLDLEGSSYLKLNATGAALWEALADGSEEDQLVLLLTERYGIATEDAARDVASFIADLEADDLLDRE